MAKVTIKDVAREAGVSISTVSNALNGVDVLKPETREHILEVAKRLRYIPNLNGRNLKSKETKVIGLFVTSLKGPYFAALADAVFRECIHYGYELNVFVTWDNASAMNNILGKRVDGCIILDNTLSAANAKRVREYDIPAVFLDRELADRRISSVIFDSEKDGQLAAEYLVSKGARKLGFIRGFPGNYDATLRFEGFQEKLQSLGITVEPEYILEGSFEKNVAYSSVKAFLEKGLQVPDAFFAANDLSAIGVMEALMEAGYRVPEDVMVVGVDDVEQGEWFKPTLTTIKTGFEEQGVIAVRKLMKLINEEEAGSIERLSGKLIERESSKIR